MRFNILISLTFLATLAGALFIPVDDLERRDLDMQESFMDDAAGSMVFSREPKLSEAKKARNAAASAIKRAEIKESKASRRAHFQAAAKAHRQTTNLPYRKSTFHVEGGVGRPAQTYTGKEVRKAVFDSHMTEEELKKLSKTKARNSNLKPFGNYPVYTPKAHGNAAARPLRGMRVDTISKKPTPPGRDKGKEFPLPNHVKPGDMGPARVIRQKTKAGNWQFKGVVAHDQSRPRPPEGSREAAFSGYNDHFQVKEHKAPKANWKTT